jgi:hypothetical protein
MCMGGKSHTGSVLFRLPDMYFYIGQNLCFPIYSGIGQNLPEYTRYVLTSAFCKGKVYERGTLVLGTRY